MGEARAESAFKPSDIAHPVLVGALAVSCVVVLVARFVVPTPLWLDEALSVNIAKLPVGDIPEALKHDGHPPLYYVLLHFWMEVVGTGDKAVRAMSGLISLVALPLAYRAGRRIAGPRVGWMTVIVLCLSPFFLRYGSETRMYSLVIVLSLAGYLAVQNALDTPRFRWWICTALITAALLWTHYWSLWLLASVGLLLVIRFFRRSHVGALDRPTLWVLGSMGVGALLFAPWVPTMLYQAAHTGTPWAKPFRPATLLVLTLTDFAGGPYSEPQVLMFFTLLLLAVGVFGRGIDDWRIELDLHTQPEARIPASILAMTVGIASLIGLATRSTFASRYAAVFFPFFVLLVALGLDHVKGRVTRNLALSVFLVLSLVGLGVVFTYSRTQAREIADAMVASEPADAIVVACPDQLGPSVDRAVRQEVGDDWEVVTYPRFDSPERVDWVDYKERNAQNDPAAFATELLERAGDRTIFVAMSNTYRTLEGQCGAVISELAEARSPQIRVEGNAEDFYEPIALYILEPPPAP